jgi:CelD/BcsL family acetyltransferase involved in cellulose biosynthesis
MSVIVMPASEFSDLYFERWLEVQESNPLLRSPFFRPEFTRSVAKVRNDVFVAVVDGGDAFFAFQRSSLGLGRPVGGRLSDYHGLIAEQGYSCDILQLMRACGLRSWSFDHIPSSQTMFSPWRAADAFSPTINLEGGLRPGTSSMYATHRRKARRLEREFGKIEFDIVSLEPAVVACCVDWKSQQYRDGGNADIFGRPWARQLISELAAFHGSDFSGMASVMRAGGRPVAAHFGLRSRSCLHYWFPSYDRRLHSFSPGILLLLEMIAVAPSLGISVIDFGKGSENYKYKFANEGTPLIEGMITESVFFRGALRAQCEARAFVKTMPAVRTFLGPARRLYQLFGLR